MPHYEIQHKIRTVANIWDPVSFRAFRFERWRLESGAREDYWLAFQTIEAESGTAAMQVFRRELRPIVDCLSVLTQCAFSLRGTSFFVRRLDENPDGIFFRYLARSRQPLGTSFWSDAQRQDLERLVSNEDIQGAIHYLREANNTTTAKTRLAVLVIVAESLAGSGVRYGNCSKCDHRYEYPGTDQDELRSVLGSHVYEALYRRNAGAFRHRLFHGTPLADQELGTLPADSYNAILEYLKTTYNLSTLRVIVNAPRTFDGSFEQGAIFLRPEDPEAWDLRSVEKHGPDAPGLQIVERPEGY